MKAKQMDGSDVAVVAGVLLVLWALWLWFGVAAVLAFVGTVLIVLGVAQAARFGNGAGR